MTDKEVIEDLMRIIDMLILRANGELHLRGDVALFIIGRSVNKAKKYLADTASW